MKWQVTFNIFRYKQDGNEPYFETYKSEVKSDDYVLDAVERIWAEQDRSLVFRHACHHAGCGACGMRVNGREKLTCITRIDRATTDGGTLTLEPLRNLPVLSDLVVDLESFFSKMEQAQFVTVRSADPLINYETKQPIDPPVPVTVFENCIECAICVSVCPIAGTDPDYLGPAALAAIARMVQEPRLDVDVKTLLAIADGDHGLWRCHAAFACTEACPSDVDLTGLIMALRRQLLTNKLKRLVGIRS